MESLRYRKQRGPERVKLEYGSYSRCLSGGAGVLPGVLGLEELVELVGPAADAADVQRELALHLRCGRDRERVPLRLGHRGDLKGTVSFG